MKELILNGYEFLTGMLPFAAVSVLLGRTYKYGEKAVKRHFFMTFFFGLYILGVFYLTYAGTLYNLYRYGISFNAEQLNLLPFSREIDPVGYFENVLLFIPFGFLLPLIWTNMNKMKYVLLSGASFSLLIEVSQLFNNRQTDVDDLLMNTLGTLAGFLLFKLYAVVTNRTAGREDYCKFEPLIYVTAMFLGRFLLFNEFGMVKILYGF